MAYNLICTLNLNKAAQSRAGRSHRLVSLTLGGGHSQAGRRRPDQKATGLNTARRSSAMSSRSAFPRASKAAATTQEWGDSRRSCIDRAGCDLPGNAENAVTADDAPEDGESGGRRRGRKHRLPASTEVALANNLKLAGYTDDSTKTMVMSLSRR
jgi:hypothetical protein